MPGGGGTVGIGIIGDANAIAPPGGGGTVGIGVIGDANATALPVVEFSGLAKAKPVLAITTAARKAQRVFS